MALHNHVTDAVARIKSGDRVFVHGAAATPQRLIEGLQNRAGELRDVELMHLHTLGPAAYAREPYNASFRVVNLFVGSNIRYDLDFDRIDYLPCFLSEMPDLMRSGKRKIDAALIHVSPPDARGFCSLGTSVDVAKAAVQSATSVIAQVNQQMPRVHGDGYVHINEIDEYIEINEPLLEAPRPVLTETELSIGRWIAARVEDGSTLQTGIGAIPDAVLGALKDHRYLGVHTEMWSDGMLELIKAGAVDNSRKKVHPGRSVSAFLMGSHALYEFVHDNPAVEQLEASYVNDIAVIARNPKVVAINSAVEIDLTGQVCADSVGLRVISGVGGQMDFIRGAYRSQGGQPIIAVTSRTKRGVPRIVPTLRPGAGVVTTRGHVHVVVTEYGCADLYGKSVGERAQALIAIAHPEDRERLRSDWSRLRKQREPSAT